MSNPEHTANQLSAKQFCRRRWQCVMGRSYFRLEMSVTYMLRIHVASLAHDKHVLAERCQYFFPFSCRVGGSGGAGGEDTST
jgi:hypothetical protein